MAAASCAIIAEILTSLFAKSSPCVVSQIADLVHTELTKLNIDKLERKLTGLNERISSLLESLNSENLVLRYVDDSCRRLLDDYEQFIGELRAVWNKPLDENSETVDIEQFIFSIVTYCNAEVCFISLTRSFIAHTFPKSLSDKEAVQFGELVRYLQTRLEIRLERAKQNLEYLSDTKYFHGVFDVPDVKDKCTKIYQLRIHTEQYHKVENFRESLELPAMPAHDEVRNLYDRAKWHSLKHLDGACSVPSSLEDGPHYFQAINNKTTFALKFISGIAGFFSTAEMKFTKDVKPDSELLMKAHGPCPFFATAGVLHVYLDGEKRADRKPHSDKSKRFAFALSNPFFVRKKIHIATAGTGADEEEAKAAYDQMKDDKEKAVYFEHESKHDAVVAKIIRPQFGSHSTYRFIVQEFKPYEDFVLGRYDLAYLNAVECQLVNETAFFLTLVVGDDPIQIDPYDHNKKAATKLVKVLSASPLPHPQRDKTKGFICVYKDEERLQPLCKFAFASSTWFATFCTFFKTFREKLSLGLVEDEDDKLEMAKVLKEMKQGPNIIVKEFKDLNELDEKRSERLQWTNPKDQAPYEVVGFFPSLGSGPRLVFQPKSVPSDTGEDVQMLD